MRDTSSTMYDEEKDLAELRYDTAALVKALILARAKHQPDFLDNATYERWGLEKIKADVFSCEYHLRQARVMHEKLWRNYFGPRSGGVQKGDPLADFKEVIAFFVDHVKDLPEAAEKARKGEAIDWEPLADWNSLPMIRDVLDELPQPTGPEELQIPPQLLHVWHHLTATEQELLAAIWQSRKLEGQPVSELHCWMGWESSPDPDKNLRTHLTNIRKKLEDQSHPIPWRRRDNKVYWL